MSVGTTNNREIKKKICELYDELFRHNGYGDVRLEMRLLNRGHKEVIIHCGKQYRYVVDYRTAGEGAESSKEIACRDQERRKNRERRQSREPYSGEERRRRSRRAGDLPNDG